jgi:hypothetical protein
MRVQELLTAYMNTKRPRHERKEWLSQNYGFHCSCEVCSLPEAESRVSDGHLTTMSELHGHLAKWDQQRILDGKDAIGIMREIWHLGEEEGYWSERGRLAADAAWVAAAHSEYVDCRILVWRPTDTGSALQGQANGRNWLSNGILSN